MSALRRLQPIVFDVLLAVFQQTVVRGGDRLRQDSSSAAASETASEGLDDSTAAWVWEPDKPELS